MVKSRSDESPLRGLIRRVMFHAMDNVPTYHLRRMDRDMPNRADLLAVLRGQQFLTLAMAKDNQPYLVSLNYAYDEQENCLYVHCATEGRKLDYVRANPRVWGQVIEDRGYVQGQCTHSYRSVMFQANVEFVEDLAAKRRALSLMIDHADPNPQPMRKRMVENQGLEKVVVIRLRVEQMSGKCNL